MAISKKTRFEVFKRDLFRCQYCGRTPPSVVLEADHIIPRAKSKNDNIDNLITSCFDCNRGKAAVPLTEAPVPLALRVDLMNERRDQLQAYEELLGLQEDWFQRQIDELQQFHSDLFPGYVFSESFCQSSLRTFLRHLTVPEIKEALATTFQKCAGRGWNTIYRYFCGVCWGMIRQKSWQGNSNAQPNP